jgi:hypothetical protein
MALSRPPARALPEGTYPFRKWYRCDCFCVNFASRIAGLSILLRLWCGGSLVEGCNKRLRNVTRQRSRMHTKTEEEIDILRCEELGSRC